MAKLLKNGSIQMTDGRILTLDEAERCRGNDGEEILALIEADKDTTFKIYGTFEDAIAVTVGAKPKGKVRMVTRGRIRKARGS